MTLLASLLLAIVGSVLAIAIAYVPLRLMLGSMGKRVRNFIQRARDRRREPRETPDRRHAA